MSARDGPSNPFPGFRPFREDETEYFFGRARPTRELLGRLGRSSFVAVLGTSGSGKSSLVRCGILPALRLGMLGQTGSRWRIAEFRPRDDPIGQMARALEKAGIWRTGGGPIAVRELIEAGLRQSSRGLARVMEGSTLGEDENLLIFVDQFEELFRFREQIRARHKTDDDIAFVKLLLEAARETRLDLRSATHPLRHRIFVLLTMRSDFLGDCARHEGLTAWVNDGFYLVPLLDRSQRRAAIEGPIGVEGAGIHERLVYRLLNDTGDDPAKLPILAHVLMRTWEEWERRMGRGENVADADPERIDLCDYERAGRLSEALDRHLSGIVDSLSARQRALVKPIFQRLTVVTPDGQKVRRPARLRELRTILGADPEVPVGPSPDGGGRVRSAASPLVDPVRALWAARPGQDDRSPQEGDLRSDVARVIDRFRAAGNTFLTPPPDLPLEDDPLIDISHESLIWNWRPLREEWIEEEARDAALYENLRDDAIDHESEDPERRRPLYRRGMLAGAVRWLAGWTRRRAGEDHTAPRGLAAAKAWAAPYDARRGVPDGFERAIAFLRKSMTRRWLERVGVVLGILLVTAAATSWYAGQIEEERRQAFLQTVDLARAQAAVDPLAGALVLASLAGEEDVEGAGRSAAWEILSESIPTAAVRLPGEIRALDVHWAEETDGAAGRVLVVADSADRRIARILSLDSLRMSERLTDREGRAFGSALRWGAFGPDGTPVLVFEDSAPSGGDGWTALRVRGGSTAGHFDRDRSRFLAVYVDSGACVWEVASRSPRRDGTCLGSTRSPPVGNNDRERAGFRGARFTSDGTHILVWDRRVEEGENDVVWSQVQLYDLAGNRVATARVEGPPRAVSAVLDADAVADQPADGGEGEYRIAAGSQYGTQLFSRDEKLGDCLPLQYEPTTLTSFFLPDRALSVSQLGTATVWDLRACADRGDGPIRPLKAFETAGPSDGPEDALVVVGPDPGAFIADSRAALLFTYTPGGLIRTSCLKRDDSRCGGEDDTSAIGIEVGSFRGHRGALTAVQADLESGRLVTADELGELRLWNLDGTEWGRLLRRSPPPWEEGGFSAIAADPSGGRVAIAERGAGDSVDILDSRTGERLERLPGAPGGSAQPTLAFGSSGRRLAIAGDERIALWTLNGDGARLDTTVRGTGPVAFVGDGSRIATIVDNEAHLLDATTGAMARKIPLLQRPLGEPTRATGIASGPHGLVAISTTTGHVRLWREGPLRDLPDPTAHPDSTYAETRKMKFSLDGRRLAIEALDRGGLRIAYPVSGDGWSGAIERLEVRDGALSFDFLSDSVFVYETNGSRVRALRIPDALPVALPEGWVAGRIHFSGAGGSLVGVRSTIDGFVELRRWPMTWDELSLRLGEISVACPTATPASTRAESLRRRTC